MTDLQTKFAITLVALGFVFAYAFPAMKDMKQHHDAVIQQVGQAYAAPDAGTPTAANGDVANDAQK